MIFTNNKTKKPLAFEMWQEVYSRMSVHTQGATPEVLLKERRPLESNAQEVLEDRKKNFKPVTKDDFDKAINDYIKVCLELDITIDWNNQKEYIENLKIVSGLKKYNFYDWFFEYPARYRQTDPNAVLVFIPKHPNPIIPKYNEELPSFNNILNQNIEVEVRLIKYDKIQSINSDELIFYAGEWEYQKGLTKEYYYKINSKETTIIYPKETGNAYEYVEYVYYNNNLTTVPFTVIGGKMVTVDNIDYYISDFSGASAWADKAIGQLSDLDICERRFVYPRHWQILKKCNEISSHTINGIHCNIDTSKTCGTCNGTGYIQESSPYGTIIVDVESDSIGEDGVFRTPEGFITPDTAILQHSANRVDYYLQAMRNALGLMSQNMTNQSGESKKYDLTHKESLNKVIVTDLYLILQYSYNVISEFRGDSKKIKFSFPTDYGIKTAEDLAFELSEAKKNNVSTSIVAELTKKYLLKINGKNNTNERIIDFLSKYDKLFIYGINDISQSQLTAVNDRDYLFHNKAMMILQDYAVKNEIANKTDEKLLQIVNQQLDKIPANTQNAII